MTRQEATDLAGRITQTWCGGPQTQIWEEELETLHTKQAEVAYQKLRRSSKSAPSIAEFLDTYQALGGHDLEVSTCRDCAGLGWRDVTDYHRHTERCNDHDNCACSAMAPCNCRDGERARTQLARIVRQRAERADRQSIGT